jgi:arylsulfatase A-like enzyme
MLKRTFLNRRQFLRDAAVSAATLAAGSSHASSTLDKRRNVILIISDTMRQDALNCYGGRWIDTPQLNVFAQSAVRFENAYLCSFPTVPTRHDILTGQYTFTFKSWSPLDKDAVTLQDVLRPAGVYTALVADTPHPFRPKYNYQRNFDFVHINRGQENDEYKTEPARVMLPCDPKKLRGGEKVVSQYLRNVADRRTEEDYFCARTMRRAAEWLENSYKRQPFFLYVDTFDPHEPWDPPKSYVQKYDPDYTGQEVIYPRYDQWRDFLTEAELRHCRALYAGEASMVDRWVGHLLDKIRALGLLENTLVLFVADHGFYLGEHGYIGKSLIRGDQFQSLPLYSEVCRIPLLAHFPDCQPGTIECLAQTVNIPATVLDFLGVKPPPSFVARSLWPILQRKENKLSDFVISSPTLSHPGMKVPQPTNRATISDGRWLLVFGSSARTDTIEKTASVDSQPRLVAPLTGEKLAPELYDLKTDPGCVKDIAAGDKGRVTELHRQFVEFLSHSRMNKDHLRYFTRI